MDVFEISGILLSTAIGILGYLNIEIIKNLAQKLTSDKPKILIYSYIILITITSIPSIIGYSLPPEEDVAELKKVEIIQTIPKTKEEVYLETGKEIASLANSIIDKRKNKRQMEDSVYNSNKPQQWVYKIGELTNSEDELFEMYTSFDNKGNISLFYDGDYYFFFKDNTPKREQISNLVDSLSIQFHQKISIVDLYSYCSIKKQKIVKIKDVKLGKWKRKVFIECFKAV